VTDVLDVTDDMVDQVSWSAARIGRRYPYTPVADLRQEGMVWIYSHQNRVVAWMHDEENPKRGWARFTRAVEAAMEKMARAEKAGREGYDPDDEEFYARSMIELVLPAVWDQGYRSDGPSREGREPTSGGHDASEGNTWAAMVLDVEQAYWSAALSYDDRTLLRARLGDGGMTYAELGRMFECSHSTAEVRVKKALRRIQNELGGSRPVSCEPGCDCGGPGSRKSTSNAAALARTQNDYEE
jgi:hypothetical protein